jgi:GTP 3',8-cyclase
MENNIDYLRLSLTDKCNLNCIYCTPLEKGRFLARNEVLSYEEIVKAVTLFVKAGIRKLRLTGGEPLIKKGIVGLVRMLKDIKGLEEIAMTTNGVYLKNLTVSLKQAGLQRINISIDTLKKDKFKSITGFDFFDDVWAGIKEALEAGFSPVKLNVILIKGINDNEIADFAQLSLDYPLVVRFIEFFPTNKRSMKFSDCLLKSDEVKKEIVEKFGAIESASGVKGNGPAEYYKLNDSKGLIGFISSSSKDFCDECNRIRIDCAGRISPCLFSGYTHDLRPLLRSNQDDKALLEIIQDALKIKSRYRKDKLQLHQLEMSSIGG